MKSVHDFWKILDAVRFPGYQFDLVHLGSHYALQIICDGTCNITGADLSWRSRKWLLSQHMTDGEVVQTAFKAVMTTMEHEARENFKYKGHAVFDPHYDIDKLVALRAQADALEEREAA